jgi:anti-sigma B factor antagonist
LEVRSEVADGLAVYRIAGRIDGLTSQDLESAVDPALSGGTPRIIFDMREVTFISSAGLRVVVTTAEVHHHRIG